MFTRKVISVAIASTLLATTAFANTKKDEQDDSVGSWGPWEGVQTAAGPGAGGINITPLLIQFANAGNNTDGSAFDASAEGDQAAPAGFRQYMAWYSRTEHAEPESTERGYFRDLTQPFLNSVPVEGQGDEQPTLSSVTDGVVSHGRELDYTIGSDAGEGTHNSRDVGWKYGQTGPMSVEARNVVKRNKVVKTFNTTVGKGKKAKTFNHEIVKVGNKQAIRFEAGGYERKGPPMPYTMVFGSFAGIDVFQEKRKKANKADKPKNWKNVGDSFTTVNNRGDFIIGLSSTLDTVNTTLAGVNDLHYSGGFAKGGPVDITVFTGANASWEGRFHMAPGAAFEVKNGSFSGVDLVGAAQTIVPVSGPEINTLAGQPFPGPGIKTIASVPDVVSMPEVVSGQVNASFFGERAQAIGGIADVTFVGEVGRQVDVFSASADYD